MPEPFQCLSLLYGLPGEGNMFKHMLIATDGSNFAQTAVVQGVKLAKQLGAKVSILTVTLAACGVSIQSSFHKGSEQIDL